MGEEALRSLKNSLLAASLAFALNACSIVSLRMMCFLRKYQARSIRMAKPSIEIARRGQIGQPAASKMEYIGGYFQ